MPKPTIEDYKGLAHLTAKRYGLWFNYRDRLSQMMKETNPEMQSVRAINSAIKKAVSSWLERGEDTRNRVLALQKEVKEARSTLKEVQAPYREKINVLRSCVRHLDNQIPAYLTEKLGHSVKPVEPDKALLKAIVK